MREIFHAPSRPPPTRQTLVIPGSPRQSSLFEIDKQSSFPRGSNKATVQQTRNYVNREDNKKTTIVKKVNVSLSLSLPVSSSWQRAKASLKSDHHQVKRALGVQRDDSSLEEKHPSHPVALFFQSSLHLPTTAISLFLIFVTSASRYHPSVILSPLSLEKIKPSANLTNEQEISYSRSLFLIFFFFHTGLN